MTTPDAPTTPTTPAEPTGPSRPAGSAVPTGPAGIDPRGPRVGAGVTATLLVVALLLGDRPAATWVLGLVVALFVSGVVLGPARSVLGTAYRRLVAPRLRPTAEREDPRPPRFAQLVGLVITGAGLGLELLGVPHAATVAASLALVAAFLNAAIGLCLGCELYLLGVRLRARRAPAAAA